MKILAYTSDTSKATRVLQSLKHFNYDIQIFKAPIVSGPIPPGAGLRFIKELGRDFYDDIIFCLDMWDTIVTAPPDVLLQKYRDNYDGKILFGADVDPVRWHSASEVISRATNTKWIGLNGGTVMAPWKLLWDTIPENFDPKTNNEHWFTARYMNRTDRNIAIDYDTKIILCLMGYIADETNPHIHEEILPSDLLVHKTYVDNLVTGENPVVLHANGELRDGIGILNYIASNLTGFKPEPIKGPIVPYLRNGKIVAMIDSSNKAPVGVIHHGRYITIEEMDKMHNYAK